MVHGRDCRISPAVYRARGGSDREALPDSTPLYVRGRREALTQCRARPACWSSDSSLVVLKGDQLCDFIMQSSAEGRDET